MEPWLTWRGCHRLSQAPSSLGELVVSPPSGRHRVVTGPPTHSVGGQTSNGHWRLSSYVVVVCNAADGRARRARGHSGGRQCTAGQSCYVSLGRHLVLTVVSSVSGLCAVFRGGCQSAGWRQSRCCCPSTPPSRTSGRSEFCCGRSSLSVITDYDAERRLCLLPH